MLAGPLSGRSPSHEDVKVVGEGTLRCLEEVNVSFLDLKRKVSGVEDLGKGHRQHATYGNLQRDVHVWHRPAE